MPIKPAARHAPHSPKMSLRTSTHAGVAIRNTLTLHTCHTGENGFPRRCAPRNDIFHGDHLALRRDGAERRPYAHFISFSVGRHPCVPPPTIAARPTAGHIGPALQAFCQLRRGRCPHRPVRTSPNKAPVGDGVLDVPFASHLMSRTRRAGCPHPAADMHRIPKKPVIANRRARRCGNPSLFSPFRPKIKPQIMQNIKIQKPLANKGTQC